MSTTTASVQPLPFVSLLHCVSATFPSLHFLDLSSLWFPILVAYPPLAMLLLCLHIPPGPTLPSESKLLIMINELSSQFDPNRQRLFS